MEYIGIGIIIVVVITVGIILYTKFKKREDIPSNVIGIINTPSAKGKDALFETHQADELVIQMEMLPAEAIEDESKLVEIADSKVLAHVNNLVQGLVQAGNQ